MRALIVLFIMAFLLFVFPHGIHGDGAERFDALRMLFEQGQLSTMRYSIVGPLLASPLYILGFLAKSPHWWCARFNTFLFLALLYFIWHYWRSLLPERTRVFILLSLIGASMFAKHITDFYGEVFAAVLVTIGLALVSAQKPKKYLGWALCVLGTINTPATLPALALVALYSAWRERDPKVLTAPAVAAILFFAENLLRFGHLMSGYMDMHGGGDILPYSTLPGFSYPLFFGVLSLLLSFGKGLLFFTPGIFLYLYWRKTLTLALPIRETLDKLCIYSLGLLLVYARWWDWGGDWFWGPRFFLLSSVPGAIFLGILLAEPPKHFAKMALLLLATTLSFWVGANGVAFDQSNLEACGVKDMSYLCHYAAEYSVLWRPFIVGASFHAKQVAYLVFFAAIYLWVSKSLWQFFLRRLKRRATYWFRVSILQPKWRF